MAATQSLRVFDPQAPSRQLAVAGESPSFGPATALYRFYDQNAALLYVGVTGQPRERWVKHRRHAAWWAMAAFVSVEIWPSLHTALDAERDAIRHEAPQFNKRSKKEGN